MSTHATIPAPADAGTRSSDRPGAVAPSLADSFAHCREVTRRSARNFYYGLRLTPEPRRSAVYSIYAWMRHADDIVDDPAPAALRKERLATLAAHTESIIRATPASGPAADSSAPHDLVQSAPVPAGATEPFWPAFAHTLAAYPIDHACFRDMVAGLAHDLEPAGYATQADLDQYCYCVASTVGLVCVAIWGLRPGVTAQTARPLAIARGKAFQLTNILRDIGHDFDESPRRVYVPREVLARHGLTADELRAWARPDACRALVLDLADLARERYRESAGLEDLIDPACAPAMWGMTRIYSGLLEAIAADPARVVGPGRVRLSSVTKGLIAVRALVRSRIGARSGGSAA